MDKVFTVVSVWQSPLSLLLSWLVRYCCCGPTFLPGPLAVNLIVAKTTSESAWFSHTSFLHPPDEILDGIPDVPTSINSQWKIPWVCDPGLDGNATATARLLKPVIKCIFVVQVSSSVEG